MTKETCSLYFKNWYVYDVFVNLAFLILTIAFLQVNVSPVFNSILIVLYGSIFIASLHNAYISIKHRIMPDVSTALFTRTFKTVIKLIELTVYLKVAYYMYKVDGALFFLSMAVLVFAMIRILLTVAYIGMKLRDEGHLYRENIMTPVELKNYLTSNRLIIEDFVSDFDNDPKNIIDGDLTFSKITDPAPISYHKFKPEIFILDYMNNQYNVLLMNDYIERNNKSFKDLTINELENFKI